MPRKKPKTQTMEERERDLAIKRYKIKLLHEQRKLKSNNEKLTFEEEHEPLIQKNKKGRIGKTKRTNETITLKKTIEL